MKHRIRVRTHQRRIGNKRVKVRRHSRLIKRRKNLGSTFEIIPTKRSPSKKGQLLLLREDLEENLDVSDIPQERRDELIERIGDINQKLKRIQGRPPIEDVRGANPLGLKLDLIKRFKGTSSRRPQFVEELNLPLTENLPRNRERQRIRSRDTFSINKSIEVLEEKALSELEKKKHPPINIGLKDLKRRKRNLGSFLTKKEGRFISIDSPEFKSNVLDKDKNFETFGKAKRISGEKAGKIITAIGFVPGAPLPITAAIGKGISSRIERITLVQTDEQDRPLKIPKVFIDRKKR